MQLKDYYKILELEPSATIPEIKKAYRRLAQQYHPDKNSTEEYAATYFTEIKEAYEVLTDPSKKEYYLQQRWYQQSLGKKKYNSQPVTPPNILKQFLELDKYVSGLDIFRMDKKGLYDHVNDLLSDDTIEQLKKFNEPEINNEVAGIVIRIAGYLQFEQGKAIADKLYSLCKGVPVTAQKIDLFLQQLQKKNNWEKYRTGVIIIATIIIALLVYFASR
jgi:curved DNA-binding protein CbpA